MASERVQRTIESLLDEAEQAVGRSEWSSVKDGAQNVLAFDPDNQDAAYFLAAAIRALGGSADSPSNEPSTTSTQPPITTTPVQPAPFANGRYQFQRFLGEGGKKKVYLAQDTTLDREVAFAGQTVSLNDPISRLWPVSEYRGASSAF